MSHLNMVITYCYTSWGSYVNRFNTKYTVQCMGNTQLYNPSNLSVTSVSARKLAYTQYGPIKVLVSNSINNQVSFSRIATSSLNQQPTNSRGRARPLLCQQHISTSIRLIVPVTICHKEHVTDIYTYNIGILKDLVLLVRMLGPFSY